MARGLRVHAAFLFCLFFTFCRAEAQISQRTEAPFVAFRTSITTKDGQTKMESGTIARRSDGSTCFQSGNDQETLVLIYDMKLHRAVTLYKKYRLYSIFPDPNLKATTLPANYQQQVLANLPAEGTKQEIQNGWTLTTLGKREIEGVMTVGTTMTNAEGRVHEQWHSPALDINLDSTAHQPAQGTDGEIHIRQLRLVEPDESLFRIPAGYVQDERNKAMVGSIAP